MGVEHVVRGLLGGSSRRSESGLMVAQHVHISGSARLVEPRD
jgi:hypothetical protein